MCLFLYIGGEKPLPLKPWNESKPDFHVSELLKEQKVVRKHFDVAHIRLAGTYEKCGCAFNYGREYPDDEDDPKELLLAEESRKKLFEYLKKYNVKQIYPCWAGDELKRPVGHRIITIDKIKVNEFVFNDRELLTLNE